MSYSGLNEFITELEKNSELLRIKQFADPVLEITEITDRVVKSGGKALLFENTGTYFPLLINAFGSDKRMSMAIGQTDLDDAGKEIENLFSHLIKRKKGFFAKLTGLPDIIRISTLFPAHLHRKGMCQKHIIYTPDLGIFPVLKCWPHDGGRYITLPMVHSVHPETGSENVGMYRMQILDKNSTAMHWQRHKTGANHFEAWKKTGKKMPVTVTLGGDPVYTYAATAPLPENVNEYILAGFLRKKKVRLVKCMTNDLFIPDDADIVIEGFVDPAEEPVWEGPFGDHTGFYSLADWYPRFHVTCITYSDKAVYPATIVGIPPQEDAWITKATEKLFLSPLKIAMQPEIEDLHLPDAGTAHNLVIVKIRKSYPGQGMKIINSLWGAGQMMFSKYIIVTSGDINIRNYTDLLHHVFINADIKRDVLYVSGPLDVLDHSSDHYSFGGKAGIDATIKQPEENHPDSFVSWVAESILPVISKVTQISSIKKINSQLIEKNIPLLIVAAEIADYTRAFEELVDFFRNNKLDQVIRLTVVVDAAVDVDDLFMVAWQVLSNSDPQRDHSYISDQSVILDGTVKIFHNGGFVRKWPDIVISDDATIKVTDMKWNSLDIGNFVSSPSARYKRLSRSGNAEVSKI